MSTHSVAEAKNQLSRLIDSALRGEAVVITRHGFPVVELTPVNRQARHSARDAMAWLEGKHTPPPDGVDPLAVLAIMRDED